MIFSKPQKNSVPNTKPPISYTRINISTKNKDGTVGDLIFETSELFSFGVSENTDPTTQKVNGYVLPLCLWNKDGATEEEMAFTTTFDRVVERAKRHILEIREDIEKYDLDENSESIKKLNPLYWRKVKGKIVDGTGPTLYARLIQSKKHDKIVTEFYDSNGEEIDPLALVGKYCYAKCAIKIESIYVGKSISLQVKIYEAEVRVLDGGKKRLLTRPVASNPVVSVSSSSAPFEDDEPSGPGSVQASEDEAEPPKPKEEEVKKVVRRVPKKRTDN
jgi:hypothetical protein